MLLVQLDRGVAEGDRALADGGLGARAASGRGRAAGAAAQDRARGAERFGLCRGLLHLTEDLGLAQHHRLQAAGDREQVPSRFGASFDVEAPFLLDLGSAAEKHRGQAALEGVLLVAVPQVDLGAVAGGEKQRLFDRGLGDQPDQDVLAVGAGVGDALAQIERRAAVVDSDHEDRKLAAAGVAAVGTDRHQRNEWKSENQRLTAKSENSTVAKPARLAIATSRPCQRRSRRSSSAPA